ncbi:MAG: class I tRNA ligase family protein, partial [Dehalococcoidia bacterium]
LAHVLERTLRLLHPFMPFITEEIWQKLKARLPGAETLPPSIMVAPYPESWEARLDSQAEAHINLVRDMVTQVRNYRAEQKVEVGRQIGAVIDLRGQAAGVDVAALKEAIQGETGPIRHLARIGDLSVVGLDDPEPRYTVSNSVVIELFGGQRRGYGHAKILLPLAGLRDVDQERAKLQRELGELQQAIARLAAQLDNEEFRAKAPAEVQQRMDRNQVANFMKKRRLEESLAKLG